MTLYSHNGAYPAPLPNKIVLSSGVSRTDKTTFTPEEIADAGYVEVSAPPPVLYPNRLEWSGTDWVIRQPNDQEVLERWKEVRNIRDRKIAYTDFLILKAYEQGQPVDQTLATYRQALRDIPQNNVDPFFITWPSLPED